MVNRISGIVFDCGDTLIYPRDGEWIPTASIAELIQAELPLNVGAEEIHKALGKPLRQLELNHSAQTLAQEHRRWRQFYTDLIAEVARRAGKNPQELKVDEQLLQELLQLLHEPSTIDVFPDAEPTLKKLRKSGYTLAILSNSWPSLRPLLNNLGIDRYFDTIVISAELGVKKPQPGAYAAVCNELAVSGSELLFIDNDLDNVVGAVECSMVGFLLDRKGLYGGEATRHGIDVIGSLAKLIVYV